MKPNRLTKARLAARVRRLQKYPRILGPKNYLRCRLPLRDVNDYATVLKAAKCLLVGFCLDEEQAMYHLRLWGRVGGVAVRGSAFIHAIAQVRQARAEATQVRFNSSPAA